MKKLIRENIEVFNVTGANGLYVIEVYRENGGPRSSGYEAKINWTPLKSSNEKSTEDYFCSTSREEATQMAKSSIERKEDASVEFVPGYPKY